MRVVKWGIVSLVLKGVEFPGCDEFAYRDKFRDFRSGSKEGRILFSDITSVFATFPRSRPLIPRGGDVMAVRRPL